MPVGVGLRVGSVVSTAVVASNDPGTPDPVVFARDTVLRMCADGTTVLGGAAPFAPGDEGTGTVSNFLSKVGDPAGVTASDGSQYRADDLVAGAMRCLLSTCEPLPDRSGRSGGTPEIMAAYPSSWDSTMVAALRESLDYIGLPHVSLVSDAEAAAAWFESEIAARPGLSIGIYHIDDTGSVVTLVRSGVTAGKALRFTASGAPSPTVQLATALGAFGWLPHNLDAVVVTGDGLIARDVDAVRSIADALTQKFDVCALVGPGPEQTAALGAAILAAGFTPATHSITRIGLPPSYDVTEVLQAVTGSLHATTGSAQPTADPAAATPTGLRVAEHPTPTRTAVDDADTTPTHRHSLVIGIAALAAAVALVAAVIEFLPPG